MNSWGNPLETPEAIPKRCPRGTLGGIPEESPGGIFKGIPRGIPGVIPGELLEENLE